MKVDVKLGGGCCQTRSKGKRHRGWGCCQDFLLGLSLHSPGEKDPTDRVELGDTCQKLNSLELLWDYKALEMPEDAHVAAGRSLGRGPVGGIGPGTQPPGAMFLPRSGGGRGRGPQEGPVA